jgi:uncharacterized protein YggT (Ycf19 family)
MRSDTKRWILWVSKLVVLVIYAVLLAYVVIAGMAFVLKLLGANPASDFADWVYRAADSVTEPFRGIFPTHEVSDNSVFDASLLFAVVVYTVLAVVLHAVIDWLSRMIAGVDRAKEREERQAVLEQSRAALGYDPTAVANVTPGGAPVAAAPGAPAAPVQDWQLPPAPPAPAVDPWATGRGAPPPTSPPAP